MDTDRIFELRDTRTLHGYHLLITDGEVDGENNGELRTLQLLKRILEDQIAEYDGDWSVYVKNLNTDESFIINDQPMKSASVMKLFVMGAVYKAFESGDLVRTDEIMSLMNEMISVSDNEATNRLLYLLGDSDYAKGIARVNTFIQDYGFSDMTVEYNGFNDDSLILDGSHFNQISAKDCGKLLEDVYRRTWVSRAVGNEIEQMMLNQHTRYKIPAGLPDGVLVGNKTGEMSTTENDAAIIYSEACDYILVVLSSDWESKDTAISRIAGISGKVYRFLNGSE
jgi:beta-lactamase class A